MGHGLKNAHQEGNLLFRRQYRPEYRKVFIKSVDDVVSDSTAPPSAGYEPASFEFSLLVFFSGWLTLGLLLARIDLQG